MHLLTSRCRLLAPLHPLGESVVKNTRLFVYQNKTFFFLFWRGGNNCWFCPFLQLCLRFTHHGIIDVGSIIHSCLVEAVQKSSYWSLVWSNQERLWLWHHESAPTASITAHRSHLTIHTTIRITTPTMSSATVQLKLSLPSHIGTHTLSLLALLTVGRRIIGRIHLLLWTIFLKREKLCNFTSYYRVLAPSSK